MKHIQHIYHSLLLCTYSKITPHFFTTRCILSIDALNRFLPVFIRHFFRFNWEGGEGEFLLARVLLLKVCFLYGLIIKTATDFSFFLHTHPISLIFQDGAPCLLGWVGLSIGTGLASSSKKAGGPCGRVSKPPLEATCTGECDWLLGL